MDSDLETARTLAFVVILVDLIGLLFGLIFLPLAILPFIFIVLDYVLVYEPLKRGEVERVESAAFVLGVIQIVPFIGGVIPGILLIFVWVKVRDSINRTRP